MHNSLCKESFYINADGVKLYRQIYQPSDETINTLIFISHGLFEHCQANYYESVIKPLTEIKCMVITHDHYGHGRSEGNRGMISNMNILVRDVIGDIKDTMQAYRLPADMPLFIYGHSMGGLIAVHACLQDSNLCTGIILEAPALLVDIDKISFAIGRCVANIFPSFPVKKINYDDISRDTKYVEEVKVDALRIHSYVSARTALSLINSINEYLEIAKEFVTPVLIGHGEADLIVLPTGSKLFMESITSTDKTLVLYADGRHQLRNEIDNVNIEFRHKMINWIKDRTK